MTRRERKEARLDRRLEWAAGRDRKAAAGFAQAAAIADHIPMGQPILVGHRSEGRARRDQDRIHAGMSRSVESQDMAAHHRSKAAGIQDQLDRCIFSDDADAPERLRERIAEMEATRDARKRANAAFKRGGIEAVRAEVGDKIALDGARTMQLCHWVKVPFPPYSLTNLGANIRRLQKRLTEIEAKAKAMAEAPARAAEVLDAERASGGAGGGIR